jgi:hypothetical protein
MGAFVFSSCITTGMGTNRGFHRAKVIGQDGKAFFPII